MPGAIGGGDVPMVAVNERAKRRARREVTRAPVGGFVSC